ncbi:MAG: hypothetical protein WA997_04720 [Anaerolineales bacterium]
MKFGNIRCIIGALANFDGFVLASWPTENRGNRRIFVARRP